MSTHSSQLRWSRRLADVVIVLIIIGALGSLVYLTQFSEMARGLSTLKDNEFKLHVPGPASAPRVLT